MMCKRVETREDILKFLELPNLLYTSDFLTQDEELEKSILNNSHPLSSEFKIIPYIVLQDKDIICRSILTIYNNDTTGYVGFFESKNNSEGVKLLFENIKSDAKLNGINRLVGPVDCSFWIRYRFKVDNFDKLYFNEPYNLDYYINLWKENGFEISDKYFSNQLRVPKKEDRNEKYLKRLNSVLEKGYIIRNPTFFSFKKDLKNVFDLLVKLYSTFPVFKEIPKNTFMEMFLKLRYILNFKMVFLAYKESILKGFMICVPNYKKILKMFDIFKKPNEYIMLYLGADSDSLGLGGAFTYLCEKYLEEYQYSCITALIHEGKVSGGFYNNLQVNRYNYVLLSLDF